MKDSKLALFVMLGQTAIKTAQNTKNTAPPNKVLISETYDLSVVLPELVKQASHASQAYLLFFIFENFFRQFVLEVLSEKNPEGWWNRVPQDVRNEVDKLEETEEQKQWMALSSRSKLSLTTLPQLLKIVEDKDNWKDYFELVVRDKSLVQEVRLISHLRNTICHMTDVSDEEMDRIKQTMRDWFRVVEP